LEQSVVVKSRLLQLFAQPGQQTVEVFAHLLLLVLQLLVLGLSLPPRKLSTFLVLQQVDERPSPLIVDFILVVPHISEHFSGTFAVELPQVRNRIRLLFFDSFLHVLTSCTFFLRLVDERIASAPVGRIGKAIDLDFGGSLLVLEEGVSEVPAGELQLFSDDPRDGNFLRV
jgi:hypothetical protein